MPRSQRFSIRLVALNDLDAPFLPGTPDIPTELPSRPGMRLAIFELDGYLGIKSYIAIPTSAPDEDAMISDARARLHDMLSSLATDSHTWKLEPQERGGTP